MDPQVITDVLAKFSGSQRRFDVIGTTANGVKIIDDYAHHPTEIRATLYAAKNMPHGRLWCLFQPHTYTRTQTFLREFAESLKQADHVYLCDIFGSAREREGKLSIRDLQAQIPRSQLLEEDNVAVLKQHPDAVLVFMGAGDIQKFQRAYEQAVLSA